MAEIASQQLADIEEVLDEDRLVEAEAGAVFFCAVVVLTMLAAMSFDPRLIWDRLESVEPASTPMTLTETDKPA